MKENMQENSKCASFRTHQFHAMPVPKRFNSKPCDIATDRHLLYLIALLSPKARIRCAGTIELRRGRIHACHRESLQSSKMSSTARARRCSFLRWRSGMAARLCTCTCGLLWNLDGERESRWSRCCCCSCCRLRWYLVSCL